jgi:hypothetical protein
MGAKAIRGGTGPLAGRHFHRRRGGYGLISVEHWFGKGDGRWLGESAQVNTARNFPTLWRI